MWHNSLFSFFLHWKKCSCSSAFFAGHFSTRFSLMKALTYREGHWAVHGTQWPEDWWLILNPIWNRGDTKSHLYLMTPKDKSDWAFFDPCYSKSVLLNIEMTFLVTLFSTFPKLWLSFCQTFLFPGEQKNNKVNWTNTKWMEKVQNELKNSKVNWKTIKWIEKHQNDIDKLLKSYLKNRKTMQKMKKLSTEWKKCRRIEIALRAKQKMIVQSGKTKKCIM